jgi:hypothetical protein
MKKVFLLTLFFVSLSFANNISWYSSYSKALKDAHIQKKDLLIFISSNKTKKSNKILAKSFLNQDYIEYINENFISVLISIENKVSYPIELFYTTTFPSIFFASYKDESFLTHPIYNFKSSEDFKKILYSIHIK